ncbi:MAG: flavin reductase [Methyloceanibacter sp.]
MTEPFGRDGVAVAPFTAAWVMQVSFDPLLLALGINPSFVYGLLRDSRAFSVSVLKKGQLELAAHYGGGRPRQQIGFDGADDGPHRGTLAA